MQHWDLNTSGSSGANANDPAILSNTDDGRVILLHLAAGNRLQEHQVHERAWTVVVSGEVTVTTPDGESTAASAGHMFEFEAGERRELVADSEARVLLILVPWPGAGHPGAMTLEQKASARERAAAHSGS